jgi:hypothetical protein
MSLRESTGRLTVRWDVGYKVTMRLMKSLSRGGGILGSFSLPWT